MKFLNTLFCFFLATYSSVALGQSENKEKQFYAVTVGFYNVENLYDTIDNPLTRDEEYLPQGANKWNTEKYLKKLENLSTVIADMGVDVNPEGLAILGLAEIENREVVQDLISTPKLKNRNYRIVHYDSPDRRGVDVGLIYNPKYYTVTNSKSYRLYKEGDTSFYSRDQLVVSGLLDGEPLHVIVAHWPSRRGGEKRSAPMRNTAGELGRKIADSLLAIDPAAKIIYMGDLNDDPVNKSVTHYLKAQNNKNDTTGSGFYNPMYDLYKKGVGTLAWRDSWNLFDQTLLSTSLMKRDFSSFRYYGVRVYNKPYIAQKEGNFKGYPLRTFAGGSYTGGYSDHFPVYIILVKDVE
jgi:hypothetical protein